MNRDELLKLAVSQLETYVKEHGQITGTVSGQMAEAAIKAVKRILFDICPNCGKHLTYSITSGYYCQHCDYADDSCLMALRQAERLCPYPQHELRGMDRLLRYQECKVI